MIGGYCSDESKVIPIQPPYIIFGGHTKVKKFINFNFIPGADGVKVLKPHTIINPKFFYYFLHVIKIPEKGYARHYQFIEKESIPVPKLDEQKAIVSKLEALLSELDNGKQLLITAQVQLAIYRQSLLKWAFEGKLTNSDVKDGESPEGWKWVSLNEVCSKIADIDHKMPTQVDSGYPYVSTKDFTATLKISFDNVKQISEKDFLNLSKKVKPERNDIIFPRYGTIGKNILIDFDKDFLVSYSCAIINLIKVMSYPNMFICILCRPK
ncbi:MAG: restriction endonuclease subunit S [Ignavibacteriales bacterium]|nr:restriction endonuclease subunit S [Ignavibacteriales bacterium]